MNNTMEIKIKNNNEYIPATLEVVDGVMIVSPKEEKVELKWKPKIDETYFTLGGNVSKENIFFVERYKWVDDSIDNQLHELGRVFQTQEECEAFCERLNQAINNIKP